MLTAMVAVDRCTRENGCVELVRGSHLLGRVDHVAVGDSHGADPAVVERALAAMDRVWCELEPGDGVFFHGNTLHASGPNRSEAPRTVLHVSYNTVRNAPARGYTNHAYAPLETLPDDILERHGYADDIDAEAMAASREAWRRGHDTLGNIYGYDVIRGADD